MKLKCLQCEHEFDGSIGLDEMGWHSLCPKCGGSFDVDVPEGIIIMAFAEDSGPDTGYHTFTDDFPGPAIQSYYAFDTVEEFHDAWYKMVDSPDGMWYWVLYKGELVTSGACDPYDDESFEENIPGFVPITFRNLSGNIQCVGSEHIRYVLTCKVNGRRTRVTFDTLQEVGNYLDLHKKYNNQVTDLDLIEEMRVLIEQKE